MSSKLIEHKSAVHSNLLSASERLLLVAFVGFVGGCGVVRLKIVPWNVRFGTGGGAKAKQFGGFRSLLRGASNSVCDWLASECRRALFVGDEDAFSRFSFLLSACCCCSSRSTKHSVGSARLDARSLCRQII